MKKKKKVSSNKTSNNLSTKFIALPVSGDAFLFSRKGRASLVDGGKNGPELYRLLQEELGEKPCLHRIVCTHNDDDHAGGLAELLESDNDFQVSQVWLPATWQEPLKELTLDAADFYERVAEELGEGGATVAEEFYHSEKKTDRHAERRHGARSAQQRSDLQKNFLARLFASKPVAGRTPKERGTRSTNRPRVPAVAPASQEIP